LLSVKNIVACYGLIQVLQGISIEVGKGDIIGLIGVNGAGKTTTLKVISGLVSVTSGEIWFMGNRIDKMTPENIVRQGIAHVPERKRLFPYMTVYENLIMGAFLRKDQIGIKKDLEEVYKYFPRLKERRKQKVSSMSGGEQQMVAIGRALLSHPKLLLVDEPSLGLAPILIQKLEDIIRQIVEKKQTSVILVEQNINLALKVAKRIYVLEKGCVVLQGNSKQIQKNEYVKILLGLGDFSKK